MSKAGPAQVGTTTTNNTPPAYVQAAQQNLLGTGQNLAAPFTSSAPAFGVAGFNPDQTSAFDLARQSAQDAYTAAPITAATPAFGAQATTANVNWVPPVATAASQQADPAQQASAQQATAAQTDPNAYRAFMNPYTQSVVDTSNAELRRQLDQTQAGISANMASGAAFGGSREGVRAGEADRAFLDKSGSMTAQLMSQGYDKATAAAMADTQLRQQAGLQNAQLGTQTSQFNASQQNEIGKLNAQLGTNVNLNNAQRIDAANAMNAQMGTQVSLSNAQQQNQRDQFGATLSNQTQTLNNQFANDQQNRELKALQALLGTGAVQQQTAQQSLNLPADWLQRLGQITPSTTGSLSQGTTSTPTQMNLLGAGVGLAAALPGLVGMFSDENEKTDVKKLGKDPRTGVEMAAYRYKGDPKSYPKVVGPASAQQVERAHPGATRKIGGKRVITQGALRQMMGN